jgi:hypothetical protein
MMDNDILSSRIHDLIGIIDRKEITDDTLARGRSAIAASYFYYADCFDKPEFAEKGVALIQQIFSNLEENNEQSFKGYDFYSGLTGMLSLLVTLHNNQLLDIDFADLEHLDDLVYKWAMTELDESNIDFFYGATGALSYFKQRKDLPSGYTTKLVEKLLSLFDTERFVIVNKFYNKVDERYEQEVNFSLAHGMSSVLNCLLDIYEKGYDHPGIANCISNAIGYILKVSEMNPPPRPHCFVNLFNVDSKSILYQKRLGWCFSDLNILHLLYRGAAILGQSEWKQLADSYADMVAARIEPVETLVEDPFVCHGSAGLYQYYERLYELSPLPAYRKAADYWLVKAVDDIGNTPLEFYESREFLQKSHVHSLFYGLTGVTLCFLTAYNPKYSSWKNIILL